MGKIDISQAYFHIPIRESHRRYLAFSYENQLYQMTSLPFDLSSAPLAFSRVSKWIASMLRARGIRVLVYLDDFCPPGPEGAGISNGAGYFSPPKSRLGLKPGKISCEGGTGNRILRNNMEYIYKQKKSAETEARSSGKRSSNTSKKPILELEPRHIVDRETGICIIGHSLRPTFYEKPAEGVSCSVRGKPQEDVCAVKGGHERLKLVEGEPIPTGENFQSRTENICNYRRFQRSMGSTIGESSYFTAMDHGTTKLAYKSKGAVCSFNGTNQISKGSRGTVGDGSVRQQNCSGLFKKSRWDKIVGTPRVDKGITFAGSSFKGRLTPLLHPRPNQYYSGRSLSRKECSRFASQHRYNDNDFPKDGLTLNRSVCHRSVQSSPS